jgi:hypothetical protein
MRYNRIVPGNGHESVKYQGSVSRFLLFPGHVVPSVSSRRNGQTKMKWGKKLLESRNIREAIALYLEPVEKPIPRNGGFVEEIAV